MSLKSRHPSTTRLVATSIALLALLGCGLPAQIGGGPVTSGPTKPDATSTRVYLLRGLANIFSLGLNDLTLKLRTEGVYAEALSGPTWQRLADELVEAYESVESSGPLLLVGHSYGADDAIRLAKVLQGHGISIDLLILIDATNPDPIPSNVVRCVHLYIPSTFGVLAPSIFAGNPVVPEEGNERTEIVNRIVSQEEFGERAAGINHFNIDTSDLIHDEVIAEVRSVANGVTAEAGG